MFGCKTSPLVALLILLGACSPQGDYEPQNGDIIFQTSRSSQSLAVQLATKSPYSHMGLVYVQDGQASVFEAVQPVKLTPLSEWISRGERSHFVVKRLSDADTALTPDVLSKMTDAGATLMGRDYDSFFEWSDESIYCSELVWKVYSRGAGIDVGELETLGDFDLSHPAVAAKVHERFGDDIALDEIVISPVAIFDSERLVTVYEN